jgi:hypothetical protein
MKGENKMVIDPRRRQRQLAKKAAKRKGKLAKKKQANLALNLSFNPMQITQARNSALHECLTPKHLFELGIGNVVVSRRMGNQIAAGVFLVDVYCLGVKDAFFTIISPEKYQATLRGFSHHEELVNIDPSCARKLVEGAVEYAQDLGFTPHRDYQQAKQIFGDIDSNACPTSFEYGKDNKPLFVSGPNDTPARCQQILDTLTKRCGPDGFHYVLVQGPFDD